MICVVVKGPTYEEACRQIEEASLFAQLVELRLDCFCTLEKEALREIRGRFSIPMIFTVRSAAQGGFYSESEETRQAQLLELASLEPEYLDVEYHLSDDFVRELSAAHPEIKILVSYHNLQETPFGLDEIFTELARKPAYFYKIAVKATSSLDALRLLVWAKQMRKNHNQSCSRCIVCSVGEYGIVSRLLGAVVGSPITYAALEDTKEFFSAKTLGELYRHSSCSEETELYGLLGDPVEQSLGDIFHNTFFKEKNINALYVKIQTKSTDLRQTIFFLKRLGFRGLSVTMPLKNAVVSLIDEVSPDAKCIGAVNTLLFDEGKIHGYNTDGIGALNVIENQQRVFGKRLVLLGAGGAAQAIAYEAHRRGALVSIVGRKKDKARAFVEKFSFPWYSFDEMRNCCLKGYDILINCTPSSMPIDRAYILPKTLIMDINVKPEELPLLTAAVEKGCRVIHGREMFYEQARRQYLCWKLCE